MKRCKVEAWAVCREGDGEVRSFEQTRADAVARGKRDASAGKFAVVRLVPYNYTADRVVKAAMAVCFGSDPHGEKWSALCRAVHAHKLAGKKR